MPNDRSPERKRSSSRRESPVPGAPARRSVATGQRVSRPGAKLVCFAGPQAGHEFFLVGEEVVMGRAVENLISIPDTSVSRRHVHLRRVDEGWLARDLGSGNGTRLNGEVLIDGSVLRNGDVLTLGDTELRFEDLENVTVRRPIPPGRSRSMAEVPVRRSRGWVPRSTEGGRPRVARRTTGPDPAQQRHRRRMIVYAGLFCALGVVFFAGFKAKARKQEEAEALVAQQHQQREKLSILFQEAKNLVRVGNWLEARGRFEQIKQLAPNHPSIDDYLAHAAKEIPNQQALAEAASALKDNKLGPAGLALAKVSADTQLYPQHRELKGQLDERLGVRLAEARQAAELAPKVSSAKDFSKWEEVIALASDILQYQPENRDAKVLKERAELQRSILTKPYQPPPPPPSRPWEAAINLFVSGDLTGALSTANACAAKAPKCLALVVQLGEFQVLYKHMEELDAKGLGQLLALDGKISEGRTSKLARSAGTRAANFYYKTASAAKASGQYQRALEYALKTIQAEPGHAAAQAIVTELRQKAKDVFLLGYSMKDTNPEDAVLKLKEVVAMTPSNDESHQKAKHWLEVLGR